MSTIETVLGPVAARTLGRVLHHEHLLSLTPGPWMTGGRPDFDCQQVQLAVDAIARLPEQGIDTIVDLSPYGVVGRSDSGANVTLLQEISRRSGMHVVAGTAVYMESMSPQWTLDADLDTLCQRFVTDVTEGIGATTIRCGILGEQATSLDRITAHEEKCLRAAARASRLTDRGLITHTTHGSMALEQIQILRDEQIDLNRVVIGHMDTHHDLQYVRQVLATGVNIAFDTIGKQDWDYFLGPPLTPRVDGPFGKLAYHQSDLRRAEWLATLVLEGFGDHILLAQDMTGAEVYLNPDTHGKWGYSYLGGPFARLLLESGIDPEQLERLLRTNPLRLLS